MSRRNRRTCNLHLPRLRRKTCLCLTPSLRASAESCPLMMESAPIWPAAHQSACPDDMLCGTFRPRCPPVCRGSSISPRRCLPSPILGVPFFPLTAASLSYQSNPFPKRCKRREAVPCIRRYAIALATKKARPAGALHQRGRWGVRTLRAEKGDPLKHRVTHSTKRPQQNPPATCIFLWIPIAIPAIRAALFFAPCCASARPPRLSPTTCATRDVDVLCSTQ